MFPQLTFGGHEIRTYYACCVLASLAIPLVIFARRKKYGMSAPQTFVFSFAAIVSGFFGCNTLYWLENLDEFVGSGWSFRGFSFFGCLLFTPLLLLLFALCLKIPAAKAMDLLAAGLPPFLGIVRIGCFCGGCCGGVTYLFESGGSFTVPTQLIECFFDFAIFAFILHLENKRRAAGYHLPVFFCLYGLLRFTAEIFRATPKDVLGLSLGQIYSLVILLAGGGILIFSRKKIAAAHAAIGEEARQAENAGSGNRKRNGKH